MNQNFQKPSVFAKNFTCRLLPVLDVRVYFPLLSIKLLLSLIYCQSLLNTTPNGITAALNISSFVCDVNLNLFTLLIQSTSDVRFKFSNQWFLTTKFPTTYLNFYNDIANHLLPLMKICQCLSIALQHLWVNVISWSTVSCCQVSCCINPLSSTKWWKTILICTC